MRVLIIGGTGLISTGITHQLLEQGGFDIYHYNRGKRSQEFVGTAPRSGRPFTVMIARLPLWVLLAIR
jgi:nucleoside-diphosphate-sugar epimerase